MPKEKFIKAFGSKVHYKEEGTGDPVLFLHGNPTSSYLWRNIIPYISPYGRCLAPDLVGHGMSDKPRLDYSFSDHYIYLKAFIDKLKLNDITLVLHDWGSALGFHYAMQHPEKIKGLAFMESFIRPWRWTDLRWDYRLGFKLLRTPIIGEFMIYGLNAFLNIIMPRLTMRTLTLEEKKNYKAPFRKLNTRKPMLVWPREIPINGKPEEVYYIIAHYSRQLQTSTLPKLLLYAEPGALIDSKTREWCREHFPHLTMKPIGKGLHYLPEENPREIGKVLAEWYRRL